MNANELVNILKSPTSKVILSGVLLVGGALILIPLLTRSDDLHAVQEEPELTQEEKAPIEMGTEIPRFKADKVQNAGAAAQASPPPPPVINTERKEKKTTMTGGPRQIMSVVLFGVSIFLLAVVWIPGENVWRVLHDFFFGIFG